MAADRDDEPGPSEELDAEDDDDAEGDDGDGHDEAVSGGHSSASRHGHESGLSDVVARHGLAMVVGAAIGVLLVPIAGVIVCARSAADDYSRAEDDPRLIDGAVTVLEGSHLPYRVHLPETGWRVFADDVVETDAPNVDRWARRSDIAAEVSVIPTLGASPGRVTPEGVVAEAIANLTVAGTETLSIDDGPLPHGGRVEHLMTRVPGVGDSELLIAGWVTPGVAYTVLITVPPRRWAAFEAEARTILATFDPGG